MKITIVIPTYNRASLISRAIKSVIQQSYADWELVIVDDGSGDNTEEVIAPFLADKRIRYHKKTNSGAAHSRNVGAELSHSNWVTFLDSDDEAETTWLEKMAAAAEKEKAAVVCCGSTRYNQSGKVIGKGMPLDMGKLFYNTVGRFTNGGVFLLKKEVFLAIGGFDPQLRSGQHTELAMRLIPYLHEQKLTLTNVFESLIRVHVHDGPRIRHNYDAIFSGSSRTLKKHQALFGQDKANYFVYLSIAAVAAMRTKRYRESRHYFSRALRLNPLKPLSWIRLILSYVPLLRDAVWRAEKKDAGI